MTRLSQENLIAMNETQLQHEHQRADLELFELQQYKHEVYLLLESRRPVVVPSADAHFMGAI